MTQQADNKPMRRLPIPREQLVALCRKHRIRKLALFGSILRGDFHADSDIDILVEFEEGHTPGFLQLARIEREFSALLGGRKVDMRTPEDLSPYFRDEVLDSAEVQYAQG